MLEGFFEGGGEEGGGQGGEGGGGEGAEELLEGEGVLGGEGLDQEQDFAVGLGHSKYWIRVGNNYLKGVGFGFIKFSI